MITTGCFEGGVYANNMLNSCTMFNTVTIDLDAEARIPKRDKIIHRWDLIGIGMRKANRK